MQRNFKATAIAAAISMVAAAPAVNAAKPIPYEIWASDQSNSVAGAPARGVDGSFMWIWNSEDLVSQIKNEKKIAKPLKCDGSNAVNPTGLGCDIWDIFPRDLVDVTTGLTLGELHDKGIQNIIDGVVTPDGAPFGKLHGALPDPQNMYVNVNMFAPNGGHVGIMDGETKEAIALFKVTSTKTSNTMHMTFWSRSGDAIYIANLGGRALERIDIERDEDGKITKATMNRAATLPIGKDPGVVVTATAFEGNNAQGNPLVSEVTGDYDLDGEAFSQLTPNGFCKENGCADGPDADNGGRPNTVIVCPIASKDDNVYITLGGGGLLVADGKSTPMKLVAEYENQIFNGAGCGGVEDNDNRIWLNAGASASGAGATQSTFTMYNIDDKAISDRATEFLAPNMPMPTEVFKDSGNTATIGNLTGPASNTTGQLPGITTRRDAHGMTRTVDGAYIHNVDRIQNIVEVFSTTPGSEQQVATYDLTSANGNGNGKGACGKMSVSDDPNLPTNDPAPDLMYTDPNGEYLVYAARGPIPVSVTHAAQGSCPGVGVIELKAGGMSGKLATVLRTSNTIDDTPASAPGGHPYTGDEHSDPHGASIRVRVEDIKGGFPLRDY